MDGLNPSISIEYMIVGYIVVFSVMAVYLVSLFLRFRSLCKDMEMLAELENK
jgi:hypothetical protein